MKLNIRERNYLDTRIPEKPSPKTNNMYITILHVESKTELSEEYDECSLNDIPSCLRDLNKMIT